MNYRSAEVRTAWLESMATLIYPSFLGAFLYDFFDGAVRHPSLLLQPATGVCLAVLILFSLDYLYTVFYASRAQRYDVTAFAADAIIVILMYLAFKVAWAQVKGDQLPAYFPMLSWCLFATKVVSFGWELIYQYRALSVFKAAIYTDIAPGVFYLLAAFLSSEMCLAAGLVLDIAAYIWAIRASAKKQ